MKITAFPENQLLNPENFEDFGFIKDFTQIQARVSLDFEKMILANEDYAKVMDWVYNRYGRFENIEATVTADNGQTFSHYLDLSGMKVSDNRVEVGIQARKGTDHFFERADGTTFTLLYSKGALTESDFMKAPFIIVPNALVLQKLIAVSLTISLIFQAQQILLEIEKLIADALDVFGTGALTAVAKAIVVAIYLAVLAIQLILAAKQLRDLFSPKTLEMKACSDYTLIKKGCEYLGFQLDSQFLYNMRFQHTLPVPQARADLNIFDKLFNEYAGDFNTGYPTASDSTPSLWSLIQYYLNSYNLKIFVYNGTVKIEPRGYFINTANIQIRETFSNQEKGLNEWTYNDNEVFGRKYLHYSIDFSDIHSVNLAGDTQTEVITEPKMFLNKDLVNLKGLNEYLIPFALGQRKNGLNGFEEIIKGLFFFIDVLIDTFGGETIGSQIDKRVGVLTIENLYFSQTKKLWIESADGKQPENYMDKLSADAIYNNYHKDIEVNNNCKKIVTMKTPMTMQTFGQLLQNNFVQLDSGETVEVLNVKFKDKKYYAEITIAKEDSSNFNVKTTKLA